MATLAIAEPDAELMRRVQIGDETGFALLLERYRGPVIRFLYRMVQNQGVAEELAQDVFLRVYRARRNYQATAKVSTWLFCIATRRALNWRRDVRKERGNESLDSGLAERPVLEISDRRSSVEEELVRGTVADEIRSAVHALSAKQRAAVILHKYHGREYREIAATLECSESAVKSLLFRAYENLRKDLAHLAAS